jgi:DNA-binding Xre family transcriptional regulator
MAIAFRLRELLERRDISQSDFARWSGLSFATINRMCTNATTQVSLETLDKLCAALHVEPGELLVRRKARK